MVYPFHQFILKLHSRCDLACDYCYVYTMADQRWRSQSRVMPAAVVEATARRIAEHTAGHGLASVDVVLHGGEPLLAGVDRIVHAATAVRAALPPGTAADIHVQTNGMLLDERAVDALTEHGIGVGVSLDGGHAENDRHRLRPNGRGSYSTVVRGLRLLSAGPGRRIFRGLLCTIDVRNDPVATYEALLSFGPPAVDFLLPLGNWSDPPLLRDPESPTTPYADWLIAVFDRWYDASEQETSVRLFESIVDLLLGGRSAVDGLGLGPMSSVVVGTDGSIEWSDALGSVRDGSLLVNRTRLSVDRHAFDAALRLPEVVALQAGLDGLSAVCQRCDLVRVCGGGLHWHRFRAGTGFANPSVYCADLYRLISHVRGRVSADVAGVQAVGDTR